MRIIARKSLREFWARVPEAERPLRSWFAEAKAARWEKPSDIKAYYASASILSGGRVVFNIGGNKFRLVTWINYSAGIVFIKFIGTHDEYNSIDARSI